MRTRIACAMPILLATCVWAQTFAPITLQNMAAAWTKVEKIGLLGGRSSQAEVQAKLHVIRGVLALPVAQMGAARRTIYARCAADLLRYQVAKKEFITPALLDDGLLGLTTDTVTVARLRVGRATYHYSARRWSECLSECDAALAMRGIGYEAPEARTLRARAMLASGDRTGALAEIERKIRSGDDLNATLLGEIGVSNLSADEASSLSAQLTDMSAVLIGRAASRSAVGQTAVANKHEERARAYRALAVIIEKR